MNKNDRLQVNIEGYSSEGHGVAKPDGFVLFVPGALMGETVYVHVVKVNRHFGYAKIIEVVTPSPSRVTPACDVCDKCGGCAMWHADYSEEKRFKKQKVMQNLFKAGIDCEVEEVLSTDLFCHYRNKAQYPVREQDGEIAVGFYRNGSHTVIEGECKIQPRIFHGIATFIKSVMAEYGIFAYNEKSGKGLLRHIYLRANSKFDEIMLCLVVNGKMSKNSPLFDRVRAQFKEISTIIINYNDKNTNVILGDRYEVVFEAGYITDTLCGKKFKISPQSFYQVNHDGCELLYSLAKEYVGDCKSLLDLYCGIGTVGLCAMGENTRLTGVEIVPKAIENAKENARMNGVENAQFFASDAANVRDIASGEYDGIIVDPPRKGCDGKTLEFIIEKAPEKLVYISCDSATLARDLAILKEHFEIVRVVPVDMFPRTSHVETVVWLCNK